MNIIHGDIRPENILISKPELNELNEDNIKLCDFGIKIIPGVGTPAWWSP